MTFAPNELQIAMLNHLTTDPEVAALVPPANVVAGTVTRFPGIRLTQFVEGPDVEGPLDRRSALVSITIETFAKEAGPSLSNRIIGTVVRSLRGWAPEMDGVDLWDLAFDTAFVRRDAKDGTLSHGTIGFLARVTYSEEARP